MKDYRSNYSSVTFDESQQLLTVTWNEKTKQMCSEIFKEELKQKIELVKYHKPQIQLIDSRKFLFIISPGDQVWVSENIFPGYAQNGVHKLAFLVSKDFIAQLSIRQSIEEDKTEAFQTRYFGNESEAKRWLFGQATSPY